MWTADKIIYNGIDTYIKAYQGSSLIWEKNIPADPDDLTLPYVTFKAEEAGSTLGLEKLASNQMLYFSNDKINWNEFEINTIIHFNEIGTNIYVRGFLTIDENMTEPEFTQFKMTGKIAAYGNCNALWDYNNLENDVYIGAGMNLFAGCTSLTKAPKLPAKFVNNYGYAFMFQNCTSLVNAPELPATTLGSNCYEGMFQGCTLLTEGPIIPAYTPKNIYASSIFRHMFSGCTSLSKIIYLNTTMSNTNTTEWVYNVSHTGTFYKDPSMTSWPTGTSGIPSGWTVLDYTA